MQNDKEIKLEDVPRLVGEMNEKLNYLLENQSNKEAKEHDFLMTVAELQNYLPEKPARPTVYGWVNNRKIPYKKHGKTLYFQKSEVDKWLRNGRIHDFD